MATLIWWRVMLGQTNKLYLNDGSGGFAGTGTAIGSDTDETLSVVLGDVDGDGDLDLVAGNDGQTNKLYLNDGSGGFPGINTPGTAIGSETDADSSRSVVLGDVDGDGDLDLVAGNYGLNKLYLNDGSGGFASTGTAIGSDTETDNTWAVVLGDVDGDGDLDLVTGNDGQTNELYLNDGSGGFPGINTPGTAIGSETDSSRSVVLGDVDGDGDLDLVAGNSGQTNKLYLNDGSGGFAGTGTAIGSETEYTYSVVLGDVDGDGDLDLVAGNFGLNKLYLNDGSGGFASTGTAIGSDTETESTYSVVLGDVDGDGDLDSGGGKSSWFSTQQTVPE